MKHYQVSSTNSNKGSIPFIFPYDISNIALIQGFDITYDYSFNLLSLILQ